MRIRSPPVVSMALPYWISVSLSDSVASSVWLSVPSDGGVLQLTIPIASISRARARLINLKILFFNGFPPFFGVDHFLFFFLVSTAAPAATAVSVSADAPRVLAQPLSTGGSVTRSVTVA